MCADLDNIDNSDLIPVVLAVMDAEFGFRRMEHDRAGSQRGPGVLPGTPMAPRRLELTSRTVPRRDC